MNKREAKKFEELLLSELDHLREGIRRIEQDTLQERVNEGGADPMNFAEAGTDNFERDTALRIASDESEWLREVYEALQRLKEGTYGKCEGCEGEIPKARLEVFPSARLCVACQSRLEKEGLARS